MSEKIAKGEAKSDKEGEEKTMSKLKNFFSKERRYLGYRIILFWIPTIFFSIVIYFFIVKRLLSNENKLAFIVLLLAFHVVFYSVLIFNSALEKGENILRLSRGEMRRSIAIILTIAFIYVLFLDLARIVETGQFTLYFGYGIYGVVMTFYFKSRATEKTKMDDLIKTGNVAEVLKMRYALGELSENEFKTKISQLKIKLE